MTLARSSFCSFLSALSIALIVSSAAAAEGLEAPVKTQDVHPDASKASTAATTSAQPDIPTYNLLEAFREGLVDVKAEGRGDGRMTMAITNRSEKQLRVVLPPGLVAQGATGQFGGMGGMGGGMGGGMMGGMGGMGGGMMGGMGGMGGGMMGGRGGGMMGGRGGMRGGGVMPSTMGMMMLARIIMTLVGERESWDMTTLSMGMMGMRGMGGMGGMGGGMGGMGMMGGMRSVPPTGLPHASFKPGQTRNLPARLVSLSSPDVSSGVGLHMPAKGEPLQIGDISQIQQDPKVQKALKRLAAMKAPQAVAQLILWRLNSELDWDTIAQLSKSWANPFEIALAQEFIEHLDEMSNDETGTLYVEIDARPESAAQESALRTTLKGQYILGLKAKLEAPAAPEGPAVACKVRFDGDQALVQMVTSDGEGDDWVAFGRFILSTKDKDGSFDADQFANDLADGILRRLVRTQLTRGATVKGKPTYRLRIDNASPLVLNGLAVDGIVADDDLPKILSGICVSPRRSLTVPASAEVVKELGLKKGVHVVAVDLSGL
jgi:hypothetical protein